MRLFLKNSLLQFTYSNAPLKSKPCTNRFGSVPFRITFRAHLTFSLVVTYLCPLRVDLIDLSIYRHAVVSHLKHKKILFLDSTSTTSITLLFSLPLKQRILKEVLLFKVSNCRLLNPLKSSLHPTIPSDLLVSRSPVASPRVSPMANSQFHPNVTSQQHSTDSCHSLLFKSFLHLASGAPHTITPLSPSALSSIPFPSSLQVSHIGLLIVPGASQE